MGMDDPKPGEIVTARVIKSHTLNPSLKWANTYEVRLSDFASTAEAVSVLSTILTFEQKIHNELTLIEYGTISTWVADSEPYDANEFVRLNANVLGQRLLGVQQPEDLRVCLRMSVGAATGRTGYRLYRNVLFRGEIHAPAGIDTFVDSGAVSSFLAGAVSDSLFSDLVNSEASIPHLVLHSATSSRAVGSLGVAGITVKALNNKYFDRP